MKKKVKQEDAASSVSSILLRNAKTGEEKEVRCVPEDMTAALVAGFRPIPGDRPPKGDDDPDKISVVDD